MSLTWAEPPQRPELAASAVHVWYWDFHHIRDFGPSVACLSPDEQARAARYKTEDSRLTFLGSHIFLRRVLSLYLEVDPEMVSYGTGTYGKPELSVPNMASPQFNLSHSHQSAVCAITRGVEVGIDLEPVNHHLCDESTAQQVSSEGEMLEIGRLNPRERPQAFFRLWTRKEAYAKCIGLGMSADLKRVELGHAEPVSRFSGIEVRTFVCPNGYVASVALNLPYSIPAFYKWIG